MVRVLLMCVGSLVFLIALVVAYGLVYGFLSRRGIPRIIVVLLSLYLATWVVWLVPFLWVNALFTSPRARRDRVQRVLDERRRLDAADEAQRAHARAETRASELHEEEEETHRLKAERLRNAPSLFDPPPS